MTLYSRKIYIEHLGDLQAGDLVDISINLDPYWAAVAVVGQCADDPTRADDVDCEGDCLGVIFFADSEDSPWHVQTDDDIHARLPGAHAQAVIDTENATHTAAVAGALPAADLIRRERL